MKIFYNRNQESLDSILRNNDELEIRSMRFLMLEVTQLPQVL